MSQNNLCALAVSCYSSWRPFWTCLIVMFGIEIILTAAQGCHSSCTCSSPSGEVICKGGPVLDIFTQMKVQAVKLTLDDIKGLQMIEATRMRDMKMNGTSLVEMKIVSCFIKAIDIGSFEKFPNLEQLDLSMNEIMTISPGTFNGLNELLFLNLSHNRLSTIDGIFSSLLNLKTLDLSVNNLKELPANAFSNQSALTYLKLDGNPLKNLYSSSFRGLQSMKELRARDCSLFQVDKDVFALMPPLITVDLGQNRLSDAPPALALITHKYLKNMFLDNNEIQALHGENFAGLHLQTLDLSYNRIGKIDVAAFQWASLREVDLSFNLILSVSRPILKPLANYLTHFNLAGNPLRHLADGLFSDLQMLEWVNLSKCSLEDFKDNAFEGLARLRGLDISQNSIHHLPLGSFSLFDQLVSVNLNQNSWVCDCKIRPLRDWLNKVSSTSKLVCPPRSLKDGDCDKLHCISPTQSEISLLQDTELTECQNDKPPTLPAGTQGAIVASCMGFAIVLLLVAVFLWRRGQTGHQLKRVCVPSKAESSHIEDEDSKVPPLVNCDRNSLTHSDHNFVFRHYFDHLVTDPGDLDTADEDELGEGDPLKQKDSLYSSQPSLYSHHSAAPAYGMESTV
ncbi:unnamed protein product [Lymnaea stagnalis]|uniref:LRRCT domain-containing protein n=1 Tax=Lymnaea stagnalis TaxID=6523 RepID=A0AAV2HHU1_LYMST